MGGLLHPLADGRSAPSPRLVESLIAAQCPEAGGGTAIPVDTPGWDNATFRYSDRWVVRCPTASRYSRLIQREFAALRHLRDRIGFAIPHPYFMGLPTKAFPRPWSMLEWIDGDHAIGDRNSFAHDLGRHLRELQAIETMDGLQTGELNFHRGGDLTSWSASFDDALRQLPPPLASAAQSIWQDARAQPFEDTPVWSHGDITPPNLLFRKGRLYALIDWGLVSVGDPACDLAIAWREFDAGERQIFFEALRPDAGTIARGKAWAVWKLALLASGLAGEGGSDQKAAKARLAEVLEV